MQIKKSIAESIIADSESSRENKIVERENRELERERLAVEESRRNDERSNENKRTDRQREDNNAIINGNQGAKEIT